MPLAALPATSGCTTTPEKIEANDNAALPTPEEYKKDFLNTLRATLKSEIAKISDEQLQEIIDKVDPLKRPAMNWYGTNSLWAVHYTDDVSEMDHGFGPLFVINSGSISAQISISSFSVIMYESGRKILTSSLFPIRKKIEADASKHTDKSKFVAEYLPSAQEAVDFAVDMINELVAERPNLKFNGIPVSFYAAIPFAQTVMRKVAEIIISKGAEELYTSVVAHLSSGSNFLPSTPPIAKSPDSTKKALDFLTDKILRPHDIPRAPDEWDGGFKHFYPSFSPIISLPRDPREQPSPSAEEVKEVPKEEQKQR